MKKQQRQTCKECGLTYRYQADFVEHLRLAHKPVEDTSKRSSWSDKDPDEAPAIEDLLSETGL